MFCHVFAVDVVSSNQFSLWPSLIHATRRTHTTVFLTAASVFPSIGLCLCVRACVILKHPGLPSCAVDGRYRNPIYYYYCNYNYTPPPTPTHTPILCASPPPPPYQSPPPPPTLLLFCLGMAGRQPACKCQCSAVPHRRRSDGKQNDGYRRD